MKEKRNLETMSPKARAEEAVSKAFEVTFEALSKQKADMSSEYENLLCPPRGS